jgi:AcrR family transcriptional regulator
MPRIKTATLAEHRDWRRQQLISAATAIALEEGGAAVSVAAVAERAGLSRTSVYEYFGSSAELVADLIIDELGRFSKTLSEAIEQDALPIAAIEQWIDAALHYIADGRHLLAKVLGAISIPKDRVSEITTAHRALLAPLHSACQQLGIADVPQALSLIQSVTDATTKRIESGNEAEKEIAVAIDFCLAGVRALIR